MGRITAESPSILFEVLECCEGLELIAGGDGDAFVMVDGWLVCGFNFLKSLTEQLIYQLISILEVDSLGGEYRLDLTRANRLCLRLLMDCSDVFGFNCTCRSV